MNSKLDTSFLNTFRAHPLFWAWILPLPYWIYLLLSSNMVIDADAKNYENLGLLFYNNQWKEYFLTGPNREPLYSLVISFSMRVADLFSVPYQKVQTVIQIGILILTQALLYQILKRLKVPNSLIISTLLYFGFSPAIVNSAFSLFSEILTYPFILAVIWFTVEAWKTLFTAQPEKMLTKSLFLAFSLTTTVFIKGAFELITPLFLLPFLYVAVRAVIDKNKLLAKRTLICLLTIGFIFYPPILAFKYVNKKYNDHFTFTSRGAWAVYGNTLRRMKPLNTRRCLTALAYVPGEGVCRSIFSREECFFWSSINSDEYAEKKLKNLEEEGITGEKLDKTLLDLTKTEIFKNPLQYVFLTGVEGLKMFFWESTKVGWVYYPEKLQAVFDFKLGNNLLRLFMTLLTVWALMNLLIIVGRNRFKLMSPAKENADTTIFLFFLLYLVLIYTLVHSFFFILTRYVFPLVPLYLIAISYTFQTFLKRKS